MARVFSVGFSILALAYGIGAASTLLLNVLVGRSLGVAALGTFALANSVARIFYSGTDLGTAPYLAREVARDRSLAGGMLSMFVSLRVCLIPVGVFISCGFALLSGHGDLLTFALVSIAQGLLSLHIVYEAIAQAHDRQPAAATLSVFLSCASIAASAIWYFAIGGLAPFVAMYVLSLVAAVVAWAVWTRTRLDLTTKFRLRPQELKRHFSRSWPIGASFLLSNAALRAPVVVLGAFTNSVEVGVFVAVDLFVTSATILQSAVTNASFPTLAATYRKDPPRFRRTLWSSNALLGAIGVGVALVLVFFGHRIVAAIFPGKDFARIGVLLPVMACSAPILLLVHHNIFVFAATDRERLNLRFMTSWFAISAVMQLALVPMLGVVGAAWGLLIARLIGLAVLGLTVFAAGIHRGGSD